MVPHILIVDTDMSAAKVTRAVVSRAVPEARVAIAPAGGDIALNVHSDCPDVLIIDPSPHHVDGVRLIRELKAERASARVIVIASAPTPALRRMMAEVQVDAYLEKPVLLTFFQNQLRALLRNDAASAPADLVRTDVTE
jgi:DNA-binding response OmpR family regulator